VPLTHQTCVRRSNVWIPAEIQEHETKQTP
jgi:hypothetical protein